MDEERAAELVGRRRAPVKLPALALLPGERLAVAGPAERCRERLGRHGHDGGGVCGRLHFAAIELPGPVRLESLRQAAVILAKPAALQP